MRSAEMGCRVGVARGSCPAPAARADQVLVFAAASLKNALDERCRRIPAPQRRHGQISYGASPALAKQIENGAPADLFISADLDGSTTSRARPSSRSRRAPTCSATGSSWSAPADGAKPVTIVPGFPLAALLGGGRLAMADPAAVPAGKYGKAALQKLGVWDSVADRSPRRKMCAARCASSRARRRRSASSIRPMPQPSPRSGSSGFSAGFLAAHHLPGRGDRAQQQSFRQGAARFPALRRRASVLREAGLHGLGHDIVRRRFLVIRARLSGSPAPRREAPWRRLYAPWSRWHGNDRSGRGRIR